MLSWCWFLSVVSKDKVASVVAIGVVVEAVRSEVVVDKAVDVGVVALELVVLSCHRQGFLKLLFTMCCGR